MSIRPATAADYRAFVRLFGHLETGDDIPLPKVWRDELGPQSMVCIEDGETVGYVYCQVLDGVGFVRHVALDPAYRGRGLGRALMHAAADRMRDAGVEQWRLNVKPDNAQALRLYEGLGMSVLFASVAMRMDWEIIDALPKAEPAVRVQPVEPADDGAVESALEIPGGLLARHRRRAHARILVARDGEEIVGAAVFRPDFPGAYPYRANTAAVTRALMEAMRPHADPSKTFMQLVLEDAAEVADALERAGARRHMEILQLGGALPDRSAPP
ncbi:MAG: GNAT family N-acetyltransferase [Myxococcota bacterium]